MKDRRVTVMFYHFPNKNLEKQKAKTVTVQVCGKLKENSLFKIFYFRKI